MHFICLWYQDYIRFINRTRTLLYRSVLWLSVKNLFCISSLKCWSPPLQKHSEGPVTLVMVCILLRWRNTQQSQVGEETVSFRVQVMVHHGEKPRQELGVGNVGEHCLLACWLAPGSSSSPYLYCPGVTPPTVVQSGPSHIHQQLRNGHSDMATGQSNGGSDSDVLSSQACQADNQISHRSD